MMTIHLSFSRCDLTDAWNRHTGAMLYSFLEHCHGEKVCIHILYDDARSQKHAELTQINKRNYESIAKQFNAEIIYHNIQIPDWIIEHPAVHNYCILFRFYYAEILRDVDKCLSLDCDMIINTDITKLWNTDLTGYPLAACIEHNLPPLLVTRPEMEVIYDKLRVNPAKYFCTGIMLFNLKYVRDHMNLLEETFSLLKQHSDYNWVEQDIFNAIFSNHYLVLPDKYNQAVNLILKQPEKTDDAIIHYQARNKPWIQYSGFVDEWYWRYVLKTPWGLDQLSIIKETLNIPSNQFYLKMLDVESKLNKKNVMYNELEQKIKEKEELNNELCVLNENRLEVLQLDLINKSAECKSLQEKYVRITSSRSFKIGSWITYIPRKIISLR